MILLCCGEITVKHFEALMLFAHQLDGNGHEVAIDARFLPPNTTKQTKYEVAPFLADFADITPQQVIVIGTETISAAVQLVLEEMQLGDGVRITALGHFSTHQDEINARNKIAYATGQEPRVFNLCEGHKPVLLDAMITPLIARIGTQPAQSSDNRSRVLIYIPRRDLEIDPNVLNDLSVVDYSPDSSLYLLTNGKGKDLIRDSRHAGLSVFSYGELPPCELINYFDILVFFGPNIPGKRMAMLALIAMGAGKVVVDCTENSGLSSNGAPVLRGPDHPAALPDYLQGKVLRNRLEIGLRTQQSEWLKQFDIAKFEQDLQLTPPKARKKSAPPKTVFFPTNGNGMGHAQRCALIGDAMEPGAAVSFAAFPSCVNMLQNRGYPCVPLVPRSAEHSEEYAGDLVNYLRLRNLITKSDQLVFDGGFVFDSVYRLVSNLQIPAIWIRRGLWQPGQVNPIALERERAFSKVIVPQEAFVELNTDYSTGENIHRVGPIVRTIEQDEDSRQDLRERLSEEFDRDIDSLVVTMLGGGVASERTAQTQFLCSLMERRANCLHLVVAWPNAVVSSSLYGWKNSHVIHTARTLDLCRAADLTVSAAGYNSFHEILYAQIPAILIPQSAPYLDDQERRARAAFERGLVGFSEEKALLSLERDVTAFLDEGKADDLRDALRRETLPQPGNQAAAKIIERGLEK